MKIQYSSAWIRVKIIFLVIGSLILLSSTIVQSKTLQSFRERGVDLYSQLLNFKSEKDFINNGFGYSNSLNKYEDWLKMVSALKKECEIELTKLAPQQRIGSEVFSLYNAIINLKSLARKYATRGCVEDKYMAKTRIELETEFKVTSSIGASIEQAKLNNTQVLIGKYFHDRGDLSCQILIFKENGKIFKKETYNDGSQGTKEFKGSRSKRGLRLDEFEKNDYGEFYVISSDGNLESWDAQGLIETLKKIK